MLDRYTFKLIPQPPARELIQRLHRSESFPSRATHCFGMHDRERLFAAFACAPWYQDNYMEFICCAQEPEYHYPMSKFVSRCMGVFAQEKRYWLACTWVNPQWGKGVIFQGASWNYMKGYQGRQEHFYWTCIRKNGKRLANELELRAEAYPNGR